jgi:MSHA biogenesis protein MshJ
MKQQWRHLSTRVLAMSPRERWLVLLAGVALILMPAYSLVLEPGWLAYQSQRTQEQELALAIAQTQMENQARQQTLLEDPNLPLRQQQAQLAQQVRQLETQLKDQTLDLIPAARMPGLLEQMLAGSGRLRLVSLTSLPPKPLLPDPEQNILFQHGIRLRLEGSYFDIFQYLRALEGLPEHFYWRRLNYQVEQYPQASVELELYTLSGSKEFIRG